MKVDFVTLSRSDFASIAPIIDFCKNQNSLDVGVIAGGSHLLKRYGESIKQVEKRFGLCHIVDFLADSNEDSYEFIASSHVKATQVFFECLKLRSPDIVFLLGDRWELLSVATAATMLRLPIAHHSGGDVTMGALDNQVRYAVSALANIHFVALEAHKKRLINAGEEEWRIKVVGEPALGGVEKNTLTPEELHAKIGSVYDQEFILATFHPTSYENISIEKQISIFIQSLSKLDSKIIITAPNPDMGSKHFYARIQSFVAENDNVYLFENLGTDTYYALMKRALLMVGNSSSGLWEAPSFGLPVVNIGCRQEGRVCPKNVINCSLNVHDIVQAIKLAQTKSFRDNLDCMNPYLCGAGLQIVADTLSYLPPTNVLLKKKYVDI